MFRIKSGKLRNGSPAKKKSSAVRLRAMVSVYQQKQQKLRSALALDLAIPPETLKGIRVRMPFEFIPSEATSESQLEITVRDQSQYLVGRFLEVVITINPHFPDERSFQIAEFERQWLSVSHYSPQRRSLGSLSFTESTDLRVNLGGSDLGREIARTIRELSRTRRQRYERCEYCNRSTPPEFLLGSGTCMDCGSRVFGIVY